MAIRPTDVRNVDKEQHFSSLEGKIDSHLKLKGIQDGYIELLMVDILTDEEKELYKKMWAFAKERQMQMELWSAG